MTIAAAAVLVTGAGRGIGQALAGEALSTGVKRVYAWHAPAPGPPRPARHALTMDVTSTAQIQAAAGQVGSLGIVLDNAGVALYDDLTDRAALERSLAVNFFGTYAVTQAFLPALTWCGGAIVNKDRRGGPFHSGRRRCLNE